MPRARRRGKQLLWFIGIWAASVAVLAVVAYGLRFWIAAATGSGG